MIAFQDLLFVVTISYFLILSILSLLCLPKLRSNIIAYICQGQRDASQMDDVSPEEH